MFKILLCIYKIIKWHKSVLFYTSYEQQLSHFESEMLEWQSAFLDYMTDKENDEKFEALQMERADVIISGINLMRFPEAREIVKRKMKINLKRKWKDDRHIENLDK
ncbi:MAG: hypothetical protein J6S85_02230 [Methanobrevibacter sp.]|nr:hypothetical protein [Methanobrevibacter sp.]MBO7712355.1 hypothetical protein [Methanobrevibacter sp.]